MSDQMDKARRNASYLARLAAGAIADGSVVEARGLLMAAARELAALDPGLAVHSTSAATHSCGVCGFHWRGNMYGLDVTPDGVEPVCPRCELARAQAEVARLREALAERDGELATFDDLTA